MTISKLFSSLYISLLIFSLPINAASTHNFETTRLKATAGTGVASVLVEEAVVLNPSSFAFFNVSSFYFQKTGTDITNENPLNKRSETDSGSKAFILTDSKGGSGGGLAYIDQVEGFNQRKELNVSLGTIIGKQSSLGINYKRIKDIEADDQGLNLVTKKYNQFNFGVTHVLSKSATIGLLVTDPQKKREGETRAILGGQYVYKDFISLMVDAGADYNSDLSSSLLYRAATQFKIMDNFFLRIGMFNDKGKQERGNGIGISWVQPKLSFDIAMKNTTILESEALDQEQEKIKDSSFSVSYRF